MTIRGSRETASSKRRKGNDEKDEDASPHGTETNNHSFQSRTILLPPTNPVSRSNHSSCNQIIYDDDMTLGEYSHSTKSCSTRKADRQPSVCKDDTEKSTVIGATATSETENSLDNDNDDDNDDETDTCNLSIQEHIIRRLVHCQNYPNQSHTSCLEHVMAESCVELSIDEACDDSDCHDSASSDQRSGHGNSITSMYLDGSSTGGKQRRFDDDTITMHDMLGVQTDTDESTDPSIHSATATEQSTQSFSVATSRRSSSYLRHLKYNDGTAFAKRSWNSGIHTEQPRATPPVSGSKQSIWIRAISASSFSLDRSEQGCAHFVPSGAGNGRHPQIRKDYSSLCSKSLQIEIDEMTTQSSIMDTSAKDFLSIGPIQKKQARSAFFSNARKTSKTNEIVNSTCNGCDEDDSSSQWSITEKKTQSGSMDNGTASETPEYFHDEDDSWSDSWNNVMRSRELSLVVPNGQSQIRDSIRRFSDWELFFLSLLSLSFVMLTVLLILILMDKTRT